MNGEYGVVLREEPGQSGEKVYLQAADDAHALRLVAARWERHDVLAVFFYPRGHEAGTQQKIWPRLSV